MGGDTRLQTCSAVISLSKEYEEKSAKFYEDLSQKYARGRDSFLTFAQENRKYITQIERAYYGVISDAIEGCFAFNIDPDQYNFNTQVGEGTNYTEILDVAGKLEEKMIKFYSDAAEQSRSLMADVPRAFTMIAKKRNSRLLKLRSLSG